MRLPLSTTFCIIVAATAFVSFPSVKATSSPLNSVQTALQQQMKRALNWSGSSKLVRRYRRLPPRPPSVAIEDSINSRTYCNGLANKVTALSLLFEANFEKWVAARAKVAETVEVLEEPQQSTAMDLMTEMIQKKDRLVLAVAKTVGAYDYTAAAYEELETALVVVRGALEESASSEVGECFVYRSAALENIKGMGRDESEVVANGCIYLH